MNEKQTQTPIELKDASSNRKRPGVGVIPAVPASPSDVLADIKQDVRDLQALWRKVMRYYLGLLESDKVSPKEIDGALRFLQMNKVTLENFISLEEIKRLESLDIRMQGNFLKQPTQVPIDADQNTPMPKELSPLAKEVLEEFLADEREREAEERRNVPTVAQRRKLTPEEIKRHTEELMADFEEWD